MQNLEINNKCSDERRSLGELTAIYDRHRERWYGRTDGEEFHMKEPPCDLAERILFCRRHVKNPRTNLKKLLIKR